MQKSKRSASDVSSLSDYCLDRLFDPEQLYYTPMDELLKRYKKRDLLVGRMYNLAKKYGHVEKIRTRIINAPQMERANIRILGNENFYYPPPKIHLCTELNEKNSEEAFYSSDSDDENVTEPSYENWLHKRKTLRTGLNSFELNVEYLKRKKNLSDLEERILKKMMFADVSCQTDFIIEKNPKKLSKNPTDHPKIVYPTPVIMETIEKFLEKNKWRFIDLFKDLDKDKDWIVLKSDLIRQILKGRLNANESMIDELIFVLGSEKTNSIDYKALLSGRLSHLLKKRKEVPFQYENDSIPQELQRNRSDSKVSKKTTSSDRFKSLQSYSFDSSLDERSASNLTRISSSKSSINYLQLPKINTQPGSYPNTNTGKDRDVSINTVSNTKPPSTNQIKKKQFRINAKSEEDANDTKSKMCEIRNKAMEDLEQCLNKPELIKIIDSKKLEKALGLPKEKNSKEMLLFLKGKTKK